MNRTVAWKKALVLLSIGGSTLAFGLWNGAGCGNNLLNANLVDYYTAVGQGSIEAALDPAAAIGSDFDAIVVQPVSTLLQDWWGNYVEQRFPLDIEPRNLLVK